MPAKAMPVDGGTLLRRKLIVVPRSFLHRLADNISQQVVLPMQTPTSIR